jgi:hypothetical protein
MAFPVNPVNNQIAVINNISYTWNSTKGVWIRTSPTLTVANTINSNVFTAYTSITSPLINTSNANITFLQVSGTVASLNVTALSANVLPLSTSSSNAVGYLGAPQNSVALSTTYTVTFNDAGKSIYTGVTANAGTIIIPSNASVPFPVGTTIVIINPWNFTCNIGNNSGATAATLYIAGNSRPRGSGAGSSGAVMLGAAGMASLVKVLPDSWYISGAGVS